MSHLICKKQTAVENAERPQKKWSLTEQAFDCLLARLNEEDGKDVIDRELAGEKYLLLRRNLVRFFEGRAVAEPEEAADETCNRLARKLEAGEQIENINQYVYGVARIIVLELHKAQTRTRQSLNELPKNEVFSSETVDDEIELRFGCLSQCLNKLSAENRELILNYYTGDGREKIENRRTLAEKLGIPQSALRSRAIRLREKLKISLVRNMNRRTV